MSVEELQQAVGNSPAYSLLQGQTLHGPQHSKLWFQSCKVSFFGWAGLGWIPSFCLSAGSPLCKQM